MSFVVEDGTGKENATAYISVAAADSYHSERGAPAVWTGATTAQKQGALMMATVYLDANFEWKGTVLSYGQALGWPRYHAYDAEGRYINSDIVPRQILHACAYMAAEHLTSALDISYDRGGAIVRQKVGPIEIQYAENAQAERYRPYLRSLVGTLALNLTGQPRIRRA